MITDWLRAPDVWLLTPLAAAFLCSLLLTLTRCRFPPAKTAWRVWRAVFICVGMSAWPFLQGVTIRRFGAGSLFAFQQGCERGTLKLAAYFVGGGILLGWLIPWLIEGRSLAAMGWVRRRAGWFLAGGLATGVVLAVLMHPRNLFGGLADILPQQRGLALVPLLPASYIVSCVIIGLLAGWSEENVFRGHLMLALVEKGHSLRSANVWQAAAFSLYHLPARIAQGALVAAEQGPVTFALAYFIAYLLWGVVFGFLRQRTRSIVPGFAFHAAYDAVWIMLACGPLAAMVHDLAT